MNASGFGSESGRSGPDRAGTRVGMGSGRGRAGVGSHLELCSLSSLFRTTFPAFAKVHDIDRCIFCGLWGGVHAILALRIQDRI